MVKKKNEKNWLQSLLDEHEERKKNSPIITSKFYVVEVTPSRRYSYDDGHGRAEYDWTGEREEVVSPVFQHRKQAEEWLDEHEPDEGNSLVIRRENLREFTERRWVTW
jgi:hypothetical protein